MSVLIVDELRTAAAAALRELLADEGIHALVATAAGSAYAAVVGRHPSLILVDEDVAGVQGEAQLLWTIRSAARDAPIVLMIGWPADDDRLARALSICGSRFLCKPLDLGAVLELISDAGS